MPHTFLLPCGSQLARKARAQLGLVSPGCSKAPCCGARGEAAATGPSSTAAGPACPNSSPRRRPRLRILTPTKGELSAPARLPSRGRSDGLSPVKQEGN